MTPTARIDGGFVRLSVADVMARYNSANRFAPWSRCSGFLRHPGFRLIMSRCGFASFLFEAPPSRGSGSYTKASEILKFKKKD